MHTHIHTCTHTHLICPLQGEPYITPAGPLGFSLVLFVAATLVMIIIFAINRQAGGELGGSRARQLCTAGCCFVSGMASGRMWCEVVT